MVRDLDVNSLNLVLYTWNTNQKRWFLFLLHLQATNSKPVTLAAPFQPLASSRQLQPSSPSPASLFPGVSFSSPQQTAAGFSDHRRSTRLLAFLVHSSSTTTRSVLTFLPLGDQALHRGAPSRHSPSRVLFWSRDHRQPLFSRLLHSGECGVLTALPVTSSSLFRSPQRLPTTTWTSFRPPLLSRGSTAGSFVPSIL